VRYPFLGDCGLTLQLEVVDAAVSSNDVRVLGVTLTSDLTKARGYACVKIEYVSVG